jgi:DNA-binding transcriptional LysR family regulator
MNPTTSRNVIMSAVHVGPALASLDLNLVVALDALTAERNVTRAARRLGVTQSAMSHSLRRLRDLLGDPLLVRGAGGMMLTPRAEALALPLRSGLVAIERALATPALFEPARAQRTFTLASPDLFDVLVVPPLLARLAREAPAIDLSILRVEGVRLAAVLETGELDLAIVPRVEGGANGGRADAPGLVRRTLFRDDFATHVRAGHPALRGRSSLNRSSFVRLGHVVVSTGDRGPGVVDRALAERGLARRVVLRVPSFVSALAIVARSDLVLTAPTALGRISRPSMGVVQVRAPLALPSHGVDLVWHERFTEDPAHRWMRDRITEVGREEIAESRTRA